jgi:hypothetical protein
MYKNISTRTVFESVKSKRINISFRTSGKGEGGRGAEREWVRNG